MASAVEKAATGEVPLTGQRFNLFKPETVVYAVSALSLGFAALSFSRPIGENLAGMASNVFSNFTGMNPSGGNTGLPVV